MDLLANSVGKMIILGCGYVFVAIIAITRRQAGMRGQLMLLWT